MKSTWWDFLFQYFDNLKLAASIWLNLIKLIVSYVFIIWNWKKKIKYTRHNPSLCDSHSGRKIHCEKRLMGVFVSRLLKLFQKYQSWQHQLCPWFVSTLLKLFQKCQNWQHQLCPWALKIFTISPAPSLHCSSSCCPKEQRKRNIGWYFSLSSYVVVFSSSLWKIFVCYSGGEFLMMSIGGGDCYFLCFPQDPFLHCQEICLFCPTAFSNWVPGPWELNFHWLVHYQNWPFLWTDMLSLFHIDMFYVDIQSFQLQVLMVHGT